MRDLNLKLKKLDVEASRMFGDSDLLDFWYCLRVRIAMQNWRGVDAKKLISFGNVVKIIKLLYFSLRNIAVMRGRAVGQLDIKLYSTSTSSFFSQREDDNFIDAFSPCGNDNGEAVYLVHCGSFSNDKLLNWLCNRSDVVFDNILVKYFSFIFSFPFYLFDKLVAWNIEINRNSGLLSSVLKENGFSLPRRDIEIYYCRYLLERVAYRILLKILKANLITESYVISAYTKVPLVGELKLMDLSVAEYQHGICGENHYGYDIDESVYKSVSCNRVMPDKFLAYNEYWKDLMLRCGKFNVNDVEIFPYKKLTKAKEFGVLPEVLQGCLFVLFTGGYDDDELSIKFCIDASEEFQKSRVDVKFVFRPHPKDSVEKYKKKFSRIKNILVYGDLGVLTETLLCYCVAHVSVYSACHFDAVSLVGSTYVFHSKTEKSELEQHIINRPDLFLRIHDGSSFAKRILKTLN